jgi:hypothetical protein
VVPLGGHVVAARVEGEEAGAPCGVLVRLDAPVAAFVTPIVWQWLTGDEAGASLPAQSRDACLAAWRQAGLVEADSADSAVDPGTAEAPDALDWPVLAVGVSAECGFCAQLDADLAANAEFMDEAPFGVQLVADGGMRPYGRAAGLPAHAAAGFVRLAERASRWGTPGGALIAAGRGTVWLTGYDQVTRALGELSGWGRAVVAEAPTSCSVSVLDGGGVASHPVAAGDRVIGIGLRGGAVRPLADYVASRSPGAGYAPPVLLVDRPKNLFLVYRGGEMLARLRTAADVEGLLDTVLAGYAAAAGSTADRTAGAPALCGALLGERRTSDGPAEVILFPRSWLTELVKQQSRLLRAGWAVCPDPFVQLLGAGMEGGEGLWATVHPASSGTPQTWPAATAPVREILLDPDRPADDRPDAAAELRAQVVNWIARPATAWQVQRLASELTGVPVRTHTCARLIAELTSRV